MEYENNYSLLRPLDMNTIQEGDKVCYYSDGQLATLIGLSDQSDVDICIRWEETLGNVIKGKYAMLEPKCFKQAPLCWIEGKPVYKGDVLSYKGSKFSIIVSGYNPRVPDNSGLIGTINYTEETYNRVGEETWAPFASWTWTKPVTKKKYWVNLFSSERGEWWAKHVSKEFADRCATSDDGVIDPERIACVEIELEE